MRHGLPEVFYSAKDSEIREGWPRFDEFLHHLVAWTKEFSKPNSKIPGLLIIGRAQKINTTNLILGKMLRSCGVRGISYYAISPLRGTEYPAVEVNDISTFGVLGIYNLCHGLSNRDYKGMKCISRILMNRHMSKKPTIITMQMQESEFLEKAKEINLFANDHDYIESVFKDYDLLDIEVSADES